MEWEVLNITEDLSLATSSCKINDSHSTFAQMVQKSLKDAFLII